MGRRSAADAWTVHARHAAAQPGIPAGDDHHGDHHDVHGDGVDYLSRRHHSHSGLQSLAQFHNLKALATKTLLEQQTIAKTLLQASLQSCKFLITIMVFSTMEKVGRGVSMNDVSPPQMSRTRFIWVCVQNLKIFFFSVATLTFLLIYFPWQHCFYTDIYNIYPSENYVSQKNDFAILSPPPLPYFVESNVWV